MKKELSLQDKWQRQFRIMRKHSDRWDKQWSAKSIWSAIWFWHRRQETKRRKINE